jgi:hypothetical protein
MLELGFLQPFIIKILHDRKYKSLKVEQVLNNGTHEQYNLIGKDRKITIQSNRPHLRRLGLKKKRPNWVVIEGKVYLPSLLEQYIDELMKVIDK